MTDIEHIRDLKADRHNARKHNPRNIGMITSALHDVGAARSIVIDEHDNILAGNGTIEAAAAAGIERVQVVDADGETIIAVRRTGLSDEQKRKLALYDNRTAEVATWDAEVLAGLVGDVDTSQMFTSVELARLLTGDPDRANDPDAEWDGMPDFHQDDQMPIFKLQVNFASVDAVEAFARLVEQPISVVHGKQTSYIWFPAVARERLNHLRYISSEQVEDGAAQVSALHRK